MKTFYKSILFFQFSIFYLQSFSQNPLVKQWDYRFGGTGSESLGCFQQTKDGGYILGGSSDSQINGDKTQATWNHGKDFWIIKIDSLGNKEWDKDFGGGNDDWFFSLQQTIDGGYILGGYSYSGIGGDKSQPTWGSGDYWIVKTDSLGNKQWDKDFGGTDGDYLTSLQQTIDGGYILGGRSYSGISGDKTQPTWNNSNDYWIVKIDSVGNKQWDKDFGGSNQENLYSVQQTSDGGYILGGYSDSGISGDKIQTNWGLNDYWIVKTDSLGTKQWDKDLGGTNQDYLISLKQSTDGGYILGGWSNSGISGDKTQALLDTNTEAGASDFWIVKIDGLGNKLWDKKFGGLNTEDEFGNISLTEDGSYLVTGTSYSDISGDKTEDNGFSSEQMWVLKIDSIGNKQWDKTILTQNHDEDGLGYQTKEGCYAFVNSNGAGIGGYKSQNNWGLRDYWIIKFCDTTVTGINLFSNSNSEISISPNPFTSDLSITLQKQNIKQATFTIKNILGQTVYKNQLATGNRQSAIKMDLSFLSKGIYLVEVIVDGERMVRKIVKE